MLWDATKLIKFKFLICYHLVSNVEEIRLPSTSVSPSFLTFISKNYEVYCVAECFVRLVSSSTLFNSPSKVKLNPRFFHCFISNCSRNLANL